LATVSKSSAQQVFAPYTREKANLNSGFASFTKSIAIRRKEHHMSVEKLSKQHWSVPVLNRPNKKQASGNEALTDRSHIKGPQANPKPAK